MPALLVHVTERMLARTKEHQDSDDAVGILTPGLERVALPAALYGQRHASLQGTYQVVAL